MINDKFKPNMAQEVPKPAPKNQEGLVSIIPGAVATAKKLYGLRTQIELIEIEQKQASAILDLDTQVADAEAALRKSLWDLAITAVDLSKTSST